eukprot:864327-Pelagomonas_calceolata.AAC.2
MGQVGDVDCPVFDGVYEYCQLYSGGSVNGATLVAQGKADLALNWSGQWSARAVLQWTDELLGGYNSSVT